MPPRPRSLLPARHTLPRAGGRWDSAPPLLHNFSPSTATRSSPATSPPPTSPPPAHSPSPVYPPSPMPPPPTFPSQTISGSAATPPRLQMAPSPRMVPSASALPLRIPNSPSGAQEQARIASLNSPTTLPPRSLQYWRTAQRTSSALWGSGPLRLLHSSPSTAISTRRALLSSAGH